MSEWSGFPPQPPAPHAQPIPAAGTVVAGRVRTFDLVRHEDVNGVSGTGVVAVGAEFPDGTVAIRWMSGTPSTVVWSSIEDALAVHSHGGKTEVRWTTGQQTTTMQRVVSLMATADRRFRYATLDRHGPDPRSDHFRLLVVDRESWLAWITALHGSPDGVNPAVRVDRHSKEYPFEWHWMTPDGELQIIYITTADIGAGETTETANS